MIAGSTHIETMKKVALLAIISLLVLSCQQGVVFTNFKAIPCGWETDSVLVFSPVLEDSIATYDMQITVRHSDRYAYQNLWLFVDVKQDSLLLRRDTIEAMMANERGEWLGNGVTEYTLPLLYLEHIQIQKGEYEIIVQHGMREEVLQGVIDLGLTVVKN